MESSNLPIGTGIVLKSQHHIPALTQVLFPSLLWARYCQRGSGNVTKMGISWWWAPLENELGSDQRRTAGGLRFSLDIHFSIWLDEDWGVAFYNIDTVSNM
jgi:hypothetical protein